MTYREPVEGEISEEAIAEAQEAFGAYGRALESAGGLRSADVLPPSAATTTARRTGGVRGLRPCAEIGWGAAVGRRPPAVRRYHDRDPQRRRPEGAGRTLRRDE